MLDVLIIEKDELVRFAIRALLERILGSAMRVTVLNNVVELKDSLLHTPSAVVILDPSAVLLDREYEDLLSLNKQYSESRWLLFFEELNEHWLKQFVLKGVSEFSIVFKRDQLIEIEEAIFKTLSGEIYTVPWVVSKIQEHQISVEKVECVLTNSEREILKEIAMGKTTKEIASDRNLSVHTIITHRKNIFRKLEVNNVYDATRYAIRTGVITVNEYYI